MSLPHLRLQTPLVWRPLWLPPRVNCGSLDRECRANLLVDQCVIFDDFTFIFILFKLFNLSFVQPLNWYFYICFQPSFTFTDPDCHAFGTEDAFIQFSSPCLCRIYFVGMLITGSCSASVETPYNCRNVVARPHPPRLALFRPSQGQGHFVMFCLILFLYSSITFVHCIQLTLPHTHKHLEPGG